MLRALVILLCGLFTFGQPAASQEVRPSDWNSFHGRWGKSVEECNDDDANANTAIESNRIGQYELACIIS
ncbi:hypothetical protein, partial [Acinetobacter pittii]|uniref:hypothetical protein n=1 Tax=Acinetobacter pittii TaxID=48296 RepID=UPI001BDB97A8